MITIVKNKHEEKNMNDENEVVTGRTISDALHTLFNCVAMVAVIFIIAKCHSGTL